MSFFDDEFYSTRVKRKSRSMSGSRWGSSPGFRRGPRIGPMFRVALASSLISSVLVAVVFSLTMDRHAAPVSRPAMTTGQPLVETSERIITAAAKIRPAVVSIINRTKAGEEAQKGVPEDERTLENANLGSGVIFEKEDGKARIITNAHVIEDAADVQIVLPNGEKKPATIVGKDRISDLAVLQIDAKGIDTIAAVGQSGSLREGETVIAIGNPLGFGDSLTSGIISYLHRIVPVSLNQDGNYDWEEEVIQTDAAINAGNSGGALVNLNGELVGINSMKVADMGVEGLGFAIPIDAAMPIVKQLEAHGKVLRPYLGVYSIDLSNYLDSVDMGSALGLEPDGGNDAEGQDTAKPVVPDGVKKGVLVLEAVGPAKDAGLKLNDIIVKLDGHPVNGMIDLRKYLYNSKKIGESLTVTYYRDGKPGELNVKLAEKSDDDE